MLDIMLIINRAQSYYFLHSCAIKTMEISMSYDVLTFHKWLFNTK